jgi:NAD(P)-dependent dehydrogenase (short-subunit alcohol dehydrogenase family)
MSDQTVNRFGGKTVLVTGGGRGIGAAIARRFAADGADVMLIGRTAGPLEETARAIQESGGQAWAFTADVASPAAVQAAVNAAMARNGRIDVLINNAAIFDEAPFLEIDHEKWAEVLAVNLSGVFLMSQRAAREMVKTGGGAIVIIASISGHGADGKFTSYCTSKAGLFGLARNMAMELGPLGVRVNTVSPGYTHTPMTAEAVSPSMLKYMLEGFDRVPMGRMVRADEVASACAFLASPEASAVSGTDLVVDCGTTANLYILETLPSA